MEKSLNEAAEYEVRSQREIKEARDHCARGYLETAVDTAYYSAFYAIHAQLARLGVQAGSHKQVGIEFRRQFIQTGLMDKKYSQIWAALAQWRLTADYTPTPSINKKRAEGLVAMAEDFVGTILKIR